RLADVRAAHDSQGQSLANNPAVGVALRQVVEVRAQLVSAGEYFLPLHHGHIVFGKVNARLQPGNEFEQNLFVRFEASGDRAFELLCRHAGLVERARLDEVADRFCLRQVDAPVQKPPQGKLTRLGSARPSAKAAFHQIAKDYRSAMAGNLDDVFRRVGVRAPETSDHNLVQNSAALRIAKLAQRGPLGFQRQVRETDEAGGDFDSLTSRQAHHPQAAAAGRRGNGHDGVFLTHNLYGE